ncbi:MAG: DUF222 domain-containing protein [Nocardioidaceae bacterium]
MTVQQIRPTAEVVELLASARFAVGAAVSVPSGAMSEDHLTSAIETVAALEAQLAAFRLQCVAEADERRIAQSLGATGTDSWVARLTGTTRAVASGGLWLAQRLQERYADTREAFAAGVINEAQTRVIVDAAERLPSQVTAEQRRAAEATLVTKAVKGMDPRRLRQASRRMLDVVSRELADEHEADVLGAEERRAEIETWMTLHDNGDGTFAGRFVIPELHGQLLRAWLDTLTSPKRLSRNKAGELVDDDSIPAMGPGLNWSERLGHGLLELIEHLPTEASGGFARVSASVLVHIDLEHLRDSLASARLDAGVHITAGEARRLACNAGIIPAVLGGPSAILDLGRESRLHTVAQRRGLSILHDTCAAEGCERPFAWCDIHHPHAWSKGGETTLANGVPLCGFHHRRAHDSRFALDRMGSGELRFRRRR